MMVVCLLCCIAHLLSFIGLVVSWTGVVESGSGRPGELLLLLFTLWLLVICRRSRARKEATLDSISDWECLRQEFITHTIAALLPHPCRSSISSSSRHFMATFLFLSGIARPEILGRRELGGQVETMLPVWKSLKDTNFSIAGP